MKTRDECMKVTNINMYRDRMSKVSVVVTFLWRWHNCGKIPSYKYDKKS